MEEEGSVAAVDSKPLAQSSGMKFSLSKSKRPTVHCQSQNREHDGAEDAEVEYFTVVDDQGIVSNRKSRNEPKVIPKLENSWRPEKRMKNLVIEPELEATDMFVRESLATGPADGVHYGLSMRERKMDLDLVPDAIEHRKRSSEIPETGRVFLAEAEKRKLKEDLERCADEAPIDAYEQMPIEEFGVALLRGFGWEKGKPIGRNSKVVVEPVQFVRKAGMEGLGATPLPQLEKEKKLVKPGESRQNKVDLVAATGRDGQTLDIASKSEKYVEKAKSSVHVGKVMSIIGGRYAGLRGEVIDGGEEKISADEVFVKVVKSGETVEVNVKDLVDVGSAEEQKAMKQLREMNIESREKPPWNDKPSSRNDKPSSRYEEWEERRLANRNENIERNDKKRDSRVKDDYRSSRRSEKDRPRQTDHGRERSGRYDGNNERVDREKELETDERSRIKTKEGVEKPKDNARSDGQHRLTLINRNDTEIDKSMDHHSRREKRHESKRSEKSTGEISERMDGYVRKDQVHSSKQTEIHTTATDENKDSHGWSDRQFDTRHTERESRSGRKRESHSTREKVTVAPRGELLKEASACLATEKPTPSWLMSQIRVRIVSKHFCGGRYYLKKGRVVDVLSPMLCDVLLDENDKLLQEVKQQHLETVVPKTGGRVVFVGGKHRGLLGKLLERNSDKEEALVQMEESFEMVTVSLDLVAEFIGDPSEMH